MSERKNSIKTEVFRKSIHICTAFVPLFLFYWYKTTIVLLFVALVCYIICETFRYYGVKVPFISLITEKAARNKNKNYFVLGPVTLCIGVILTALFFDTLPAKIGIWALSFGDGLASLIGKLVGHTKIRHTQGKTIAGSFACFFATFISCFVASRKFLFSIFIGVCAALVELIPMKDYDNLFIPVFVAMISQFYFHM